MNETKYFLFIESEREVQQALEKLMQGRTTIIIAHRLTTVRNATRINVLVKGKNVERGTHNELLVWQDITLSFLLFSFFYFYHLFLNTFPCTHII
jgi:ABC-type multidrug transport system fused ATPase/permease subunit